MALWHGGRAYLDSSPLSLPCKIHGNSQELFAEGFAANIWTYIQLADLPEAPTGIDRRTLVERHDRDRCLALEAEKCPHGIAAVEDTSCRSSHRIEAVTRGRCQFQEQLERQLADRVRVRDCRASDCHVANRHTSLMNCVTRPGVILVSAARRPWRRRIARASARDYERSSAYRAASPSSRPRAADGDPYRA